MKTPTIVELAEMWAKSDHSLCSECPCHTYVPILWEIIEAHRREIRAWDAELGGMKIIVMGDGHPPRELTARELIAEDLRE